MAAHPQRTTAPGSAQQQYQYPGLGLPLRHADHADCGHYPNGANDDYFSESALIFVREVAMMDVMDKLTDKADWQTKVFDDTIVDKWRKEALAIPDDDFYWMATTEKSQWGDDFHGISKKAPGVFNDGAFDWCIEELRSKARLFEKTAVIPTLDACFSIAKSDSIVPAALHQAICDAFDRLKAEQGTAPDWHPGSNDMVQDVVHPSMNPLVYGRTRAFQEECVGIEDAVNKWSGTGTIVPKDASQADSNDKNWSETYQWLPSNVVFQRDGSVKFTSYINNIHPIRHREIYATIERLIESSLPLWDQCLTLMTSEGGKEETGGTRIAPRIPPPDACDDEDRENWNPSDPAECADAEVSEEDLEEAGYSESWSTPDEIPEYKWRILRQPRHPDVPAFDNFSYEPQKGSRLIDRFKTSGLQIIVKIASIELTPDKPEFPAGGWHIEGQHNEWIAATALYYLDCENVTPSNLSFRMRTLESTYEDDAFQVGQDSYHWLEAVYGTGLSMDSPCLQNYGSVDTRSRRLLAFPNVFQHRVSGFKLADPTKPGHRRFIALWLVDPTKRIISTANVPPQHMSWYLESLLGDAPEDALSKLPPELVSLLQDKGVAAAAVSLPAGNAKLPEELMEMVRGHFDADGDAMPMGVEEAGEHRRALMRERGAFRENAVQEWQGATYNFCEH